MWIGRKIALILCLLIPMTVAFYAFPVKGASPKNPVVFSDLEDWISDPRMSLNLFEETLQTDFFAFRFNYTTRLSPAYILMQHPAAPGGKISASSVEHITFQGMFWGPLFTTAVWEVPMVTADLVLYTLGGEWLQLSRLPIEALRLSFQASEQMSREPVSFNSLFRINVLFTTDVLMFDFEEVSGSYYLLKGKSLIGRSYAGLSFRLLESNYFFAGFQFVHLPPVQGFSQFTNTNSEFTNSILTPRFFVSSQNDTPGSSTEDILYYTRTQLFLYNNLLDFLQIRTLLNIGTEQVLDLLGVGFILDFLDGVDLITYFNYLRNLEKYTFDLHGGIAFSRSLSLLYDYQLGIKPFDALEYLKLGLDLNFLLQDTDFGAFTFNINAAATTYKRNGVQEFGYSGELGFHTPLSGKLVVGVSYNLDETMPRLPFTYDAWMFYVHVEMGMFNDLGFIFRNLAEEDWD